LKKSVLALGGRLSLEVFKHHQYHQAHLPNSSCWRMSRETASHKGATQHGRLQHGRTPGRGRVRVQTGFKSDESKRHPNTNVILAQLAATSALALQAEWRLRVSYSNHWAKVVSTLPSVLWDWALAPWAKISRAHGVFDPAITQRRFTKQALHRP
jgi:hypothetical protein